MSAAASLPDDDDQVAKPSMKDGASHEAVYALWPLLKEACEKGRAIQKQQKCVDADIERLEAQQEVLRSQDYRLGHLTERIEEQIRDWELARPFHCFLRLPIELRGLVWDEYFVHGCRGVNDCFRHGYIKPITLVCKRVREEVLDWLLANRPLTIEFSAFFRVQRGAKLDSVSNLTFGPMNGDRDGWMSGCEFSEDLLARVRHVRIISIIA